MALVRGVAAVTLDNPDADGRLELAGGGRTWRFVERESDPHARGGPQESVWSYAPSVADVHNGDCSGLPQWGSGAAYLVGDEVARINRFVGYRCLRAHTAASSNAPGTGADWAAYWTPLAGASELLADLHGCGPRGYADKADMLLANWTQQQGTWYLAQVGSSPPAQYLWWPGGGANTYGRVASVPNFYPHLALWLQRAGAPDGQVWPTYTLVCLRPATGDYWYALYLPLDTQATDLKYPRLLRAPANITFDPGEHTVEEFQGGNLAATGGLGEAREEYLAVENTDNHLFFRNSEGREAWSYAPMGGLELAPGPVLLEAYGHSLAFNLQPLRFPTAGYVTPRQRASTPAWVSADRSYYLVNHDPGPYDAWGTARNNFVSVQSQYAYGGGVAKPLVKFVTDGYHRPVCYAVAEFHSPTFSAARSSPQALAGTGKTVSVSGRVDDTWRGATCEVVLRVEQGEYLLKGNEKMTVDAGWATGTTDTAVSTSTSRQFTGYVLSATREKRADEQGKVYLTLNAEDGIGARLKAKKYMWLQPVLGGLTVGQDFLGDDGKFLYHTSTKVPAGTIVRHLLNCAGVPDALIHSSILACTGALAWHLPAADRKGDLLLDYRADEEVLAVLDKIATLLGGYFGVDQNGTYTIAQRTAYAAGGAVDWTLDDDTATDADMVYEVSAERGFDEFRNYVACVVGQGDGAVSFATPLWPAPSHTLTSSRDFIGDDWWEILVETEASGASAAVLQAQQRYVEAYKRRHVLRWTTPGKHDLWPGDVVAVQASGLDVPSGTVFRLIEKNWRIEADSGDYRCDFLGVKEVEP